MGRWIPEMKRSLTMMFIGGFVYGPIMVFWYFMLQPNYIKFVRYLFPKYGANIYTNKVKFAVTSVAIDKLVVNWPYLSTMLFCTALIDTRGKFSESI